ncbi:MAG: hypothetical protein ACK6AD_02090 [Cyanobacteriota bacterium]
MATSIEELMKMSHSLFQQWLHLSQTFISPSQVDGDNSNTDCATDRAAISRALLQALGAAGTSSLNYGYSVQSIIYKYQSSLLELNLSNQDPSHKKSLLIDEIRGFLREIGDTASREGRSFQHQLAVITEQLAQAEAKNNHDHSNPA